VQQAARVRGGPRPEATGVDAPEITDCIKQILEAERSDFADGLEGGATWAGGQ